MPTRKSPPKSPRILVTDDDPHVRKLFVNHLKTAGYQAREARFGEEALKLLSNNHFNLLILDLDMVDTDSFEVLKRVRTQHPGVSVLAISGYMDGILLNAAECLGATLSLEREKAPRNLVAVVRRLVGNCN